MHYVYRCTTDKLPHALDSIVGAGDEVLWPVWVGARDWVLICRKGAY
jgi:hypothetical protein